MLVYILAWKLTEVSIKANKHIEDCKEAIDEDTNKLQNDYKSDLNILLFSDYIV